MKGTKRAIVRDNLKRKTIEQQKKEGMSSGHIKRKLAFRGFDKHGFIISFQDTLSNRACIAFHAEELLC